MFNRCRLIIVGKGDFQHVARSHFHRATAPARLNILEKGGVIHRANEDQTISAIIDTDEVGVRNRMVEHLEATLMQIDASSRDGFCM